jgi:hypothetical protein
MSKLDQTTPEYIGLQTGVAIAKDFFNKIIAAQVEGGDVEVKRDALFNAALDEIRQLPDADVVRAGFDIYIQRLVEFDDAKGEAQ